MLRESAELRALSLSTLINTIGSGLLDVGGVVLDGFVGLSGEQVGIGTIVGAAGLLVGPPAGHLGDSGGRG